MPKKEYEDDFGNIKENNLYNSEDILRITQTVGKDNITECFSEAEIECGNISVTSDVWIDFQDYQIAEGRKPESENEICITDYMAELLSVNNECIGSVITVMGIDFVVTGIIKTDYREYDIINRMKNGGITPSEYDDIKYVYKKCVCSEKAFSYIMESSEVLNIAASDFTSKGIMGYTNSDLTYTAVSNLSKDGYTVYGRFPQTSEEIAVSYEFAVINDMLTENGYECEENWRYIDIYDTAYNGVYENYVNIYDYLKDFTIVGIIGNSNEEYNSDVILYDEVFFDIRQAYFQKRKDMQVIELDGINKSDLKYILRNCQEKGITVDESVVRKIDGFFEAKDNIWYLIGAVMLIFIIILLMLNISGISDNINMHKKDIGILEAMGVRKQSIHNIFIIQTVITVLCVEIIGLILLNVNNLIANVVINAKTETGGVCFVGAEYRFPIIIIPVLIGINVLCAKKIMNKMDKVQTIELLKS